EGALWVEDMQLTSPSITSDSTWRFACRYLTGEGDYLTLARTYLGATQHVGRVGKEGRLGPIGLSDEGVNLILNQN
ncbi:MAG: hypothetical protein J5755_01515, partial [Clostridia bacterium]|nr:hypothetical protein [Clostridia bacterium]